MDNKGWIVYRSKYGASRRYAERLQQELNCGMQEIDRYQGPETAGCSWVIFIGGVYAGGIGGIETFRKRYRPVDVQKLAVLAVGASPFDEQAVALLKSRSCKGSLVHAEVFYGRGVWDLAHMGLKDRTLCKMLLKSVAKRDTAHLEPWMTALLEAGDAPADWTDRAYLLPLLEFLSA